MTSATPQNEEEHLARLYRHTIVHTCRRNINNMHRVIYENARSPPSLSPSWVLRVTNGLVFNPENTIVKETADITRDEHTPLVLAAILMEASRYCKNIAAEAISLVEEQTSRDEAACRALRSPNPLLETAKLYENTAPTAALRNLMTMVAIPAALSAEKLEDVDIDMLLLHGKENVSSSPVCCTSF